MKRLCQFCRRPLLESSLKRRKFCDPHCRYKHSLMTWRRGTTRAARARRQRDIYGKR